MIIKMYKKIIFPLVAILTALSISACSDDSSYTRETEHETTTEDDKSYDYEDNETYDTEKETESKPEIRDFTSKGTPIQSDRDYLDDLYNTMEFYNTDRSTAFSEIAYSNDYSVLLVKFRDSGDEYLYYDVSEDTFFDMLDADSIGGFYNEQIKSYYDCEKVE